jgi:phosphoglycerate dehydrogenase-like enzyme
MLSCAVLDDYQDAARSFGDWDSLADKIDLQVFCDFIDDRDALAKALARFEIVVAMRERTRFDRALFERLPKLKLLITTGMVNAAIDMDAAAEHGVTVCGTSGSAGSTAELTWGLILALMRHVPAEHAELQRGGRWQTTVGREVRGRQLGIIGLGKLGAQVARVALAFEMKVVAWSANLTAARCAEVGVAKAESLDDLLRASDVVTLHQVLSDRSRGMIGARELGLMKQGAILINTSRGPLVDEAALVAALQEKRISAGLDVFDREPLHEAHPLRGLGNVVITPHLGYVTEETYRIYFSGVVEDIAGWIAGNPVRVIRAPS